MKEIKKLIRGTKKKFIIPVIAAACGIMMIGISVLLGNGNSVQPGSYETDLESRIEGIISSATGSESVDVLITYKEKTPLIITDNTSDVFSYGKDEEVVKNTPSEIAGVMIVCRGITSREDFKTLKSAVATVLDISQSKIYIIGGEQTK